MTSLQQMASRQGLTSSKPKIYHQNPQDIPIRNRRMVFALLILLQIFVNYDSGAIASAISEIKASFDNLSTTLASLILSLVYLGLVASSFISGPLLARFPPKSVLIVSLFLNIVATFVFAISKWVWLSLTSRFFVGMSQAFMVIYGPVWVDEFAPAESTTIWMSLVQGGVPLGVMAGYVVAGIITSVGGNFRIAFFIQCGLLIPLSLGLCFVPGSLINTRVADAVREGGDEEEEELLLEPKAVVIDEGRNIEHVVDHVPLTSEATNATMYHDSLEDPDNVNAVSSIRRQSMHRRKSMAVLLTELQHNDPKKNNVGEARVDTINQQQGFKKFLYDARRLLCNQVYMCTMMALCSLYFVVTGLQLWVTDYMVVHLGAPKGVVVALFAATSATAPIFGVVFGGWLIDYLGGYQGLDGIVRATKVSFIFGALAVASAIPAMFIPQFVALIVFIWLLLFFGGGIVPAATGILLAAVPRDQRSFASSMGAMCYNLFGYFAGPTVAGIVSDAFGGVEFGFKLVLAWSTFGGLFMGLAWFFARRNIVASKLSQPTEIEYNSNIAAEEVSYEVARTRQNSIFGAGLQLKGAWNKDKKESFQRLTDGNPNAFDYASTDRA